MSAVVKLFEVLRRVYILPVFVCTWSFLLFNVCSDMRSARLGMGKSPVSARWAISKR